MECSFSRVLSKIPIPALKPSSNDKFILSFVETILIHNFNERPFCSQIIEKLDRIDIQDDKILTILPSQV